MSAHSLAADTSSSLLARARSQDAKAWVQIVEWICPFILRWCRRANLQPADCDEVSQQVLINVWRHLGAFHKDRPGDSFRGWVYSITRNGIRDLLARRRLAPEALPVGLAVEAEPAEADDLQQRALQMLIQGAIAKYAEDRGFKAFYRTAVDGLTAQEAAQELGLSADMVRQHKSRWIKRLRDRLHEQSIRHGSKEAHFR